MHRIYFDTNAGAPNGGYSLGIPGSLKDIEPIADQLHDGLRVVIYMPDELEMEAVLTFDTRYKEWIAHPVEGTTRIWQEMDVLIFPEAGGPPMRRRQKTLLPGPPKLGPPTSYEWCEWRGAADDQPVWYWDELDDARWAIRCVRKHRDGTLAAYCYDFADWRDEMPESPNPPIEKVAADPQFNVHEIIREEFEAVWEEAIARRSRL